MISPYCAVSKQKSNKITRMKVLETFRQNEAQEDIIMCTGNKLDGCEM